MKKLVAAANNRQRGRRGHSVTVRSVVCGWPGSQSRCSLEGVQQLRLVVVNDSPATVVEASEDLVADDADIAEQLHDAAEAVRSRLQGMAVDRVLVRRADRGPVASNSEGPRIRLLTEGAIVSASRSVVVETALMTGKDAAGRYGSNKATHDTDAATLAGTAGLSADVYGEALGAVLAALA